MSCQVALPREQVAGHLSQHHKLIPYDATLLDEECTTLDLAVLPSLGGKDPIEAIAGLRIHQGMACSACPKVAQSSEWLRVHFSQVHTGQTKPKEWRTCTMQHLSDVPPFHAWFEVASPQPASNSTSPLLQFIQKMTESTNILVQPQDSREISPWLLSTHWHEHTAPFSPSQLRHLVLAPSANEFPSLFKTVESYFMDCVGLIEGTDLLVLQKLNTDDPLKSGISNSPFHPHQQQASNRSYMTILACLVAFLLREKGIYSLPLPPNIVSSISDLAHAIRVDAADAKDHLHSLLLQLWTTHWRRSDGNHIPDPTERFLAIYSLRPDGGHCDPKDITGPIARFKYSMRLVFLHQIKYWTRTQEPYQDDWGCSQLERWFSEKHYSSFNTICSLQHLASGIVKSTMGLPRIWWKDQAKWRSLLYKGDLVCLDQVEELFRKQEEDLVALWKDKVLLGLDLRVDYDTIKEDLSRDDVGYCFLNDPRNRNLHSRTLLLEAVTRDDILVTKLLIRQGSSYAWRVDALREWLGYYASLQGLLMLRCEMLAGGPARGTEITSMKFRSTATRRVRNLSFLGTHLTMLTTYHKSGALTGTDRLIPHSVDAFTADLLIQSLAIARPFAEMAARVCFPTNLTVHALYQDHLFVNFNKPFDTDNLSELMKRQTQPILGVGLTVNPWRHIAIAFRRRLCRGASNLFEDEEEIESVNALASGHSRAQENRTYGISVDTLAGPGEDVLPLYLDASTDWHKVTHTVPGGVMLPYDQAMGKFFGELARVRVIPADGPSGTKPQSVDEDKISQDVSQKVSESLKADLPGIVQHALAQVLGSLDISGSAASVAFNPLDARIQPGSHPQSGPSGGHPALNPSILPDHHVLSRAAQRRQRKGTMSSGKPPSELDIMEAPPPSFPIPDHLQPEQPSIPAPTSVFRTSQEPSEDLALETISNLIRRPGVSWTSRSQKVAMMAILDHKTDVVAVLPTNAGKSMLMVVPPLMEQNKVTVGILPLKSLLVDFRRRLDKMQVGYEVWTGDGQKRLTGQHNLVLVLIDQVVKPSWRQAAAELNEQKPIWRFVFDEAHFALTSRDFRDCLREVYAIRTFSAQLVLMSGTISPLSEPALRDSFGLLPDTEVIREIVTSRSEIQYIV
ncbi:uncharacterized protein C8Q71DRAFT_719204, partial [Rhodofomes roseus]